MNCPLLLQAFLQTTSILPSPSSPFHLCPAVYNGRVLVQWINETTEQDPHNDRANAKHRVVLDEFRDEVEKTEGQRDEDAFRVTSSGRKREQDGETRHVPGRDHETWEQVRSAEKAERPGDHENAEDVTHGHGHWFRRWMKAREKDEVGKVEEDTDPHENTGKDGC